MRRLCVFCGSHVGARESYARAARELGSLLAGRGIGLVYGGGRVGLMGILADAALAGGGEVIGVITQGLLDREVGHGGLTELLVVETMHERKALMARLADGFVALPGGIGTLDELFEIWTWRQLGIHDKPLALLSVEGYFEPLVNTVDHLVTEGFLSASTRRALALVSEPGELMAYLDASGWAGGETFKP